MAGNPYLSKSRLISAWQCPKKLHLEAHHRDLGVITAQMESMFAGGHQVGDIAQQLIDSGADFPIFEATFRHEGVLVRVDVLIPDGDGWRA